MRRSTFVAECESNANPAPDPDNGRPSDMVMSSHVDPDEHTAPFRAYRMMCPCVCMRVFEIRCTLLPIPTNVYATEKLRAHVYYQCRSEGAYHPDIDMNLLLNANYISRRSPQFCGEYFFEKFSRPHARIIVTFNLKIWKHSKFSAILIGDNLYINYMRFKEIVHSY